VVKATPIVAANQCKTRRQFMRLLVFPVTAFPLPRLPSMIPCVADGVIFPWKKGKMPGRILVIDDEPQITRVLRAALTAQGFDVRTANDPEEGLLVFREWTPDLVITDLMMPGMSGVEVCRAIRAQARTPVLVLSVRDHERSKVEALDAGADDYVTKPFGIQELLARVRAHLRRAPERSAAPIETGDFVVDAAAHTITVQGKLIHLTPKEFDLLSHLARHAGKVMTHRALLTAVWGGQSAHQPEYLRVFVGQLRKKLENETGRQYIQTEPWVGYRFIPEGWAGNEE
jgi:two-component system KDP operon response regulator KdpE